MLNKFSQENKKIFIETSTITEEGTDKLFELIMDNITKRILNQYHPEQENEENEESIKS